MDELEANEAHEVPEERLADVNNGKQVKNQLTIWDNLVDWRIKMQKVLFNCNKLPQPDVWNDVEEDVEQESSSASSKLKDLLASLLQLEDSLVAQNSKLFSEKSKTRHEESGDDDEEVPSDEDEGILDDDEAIDSDEGENDDEEDMGNDDGEEHGSMDEEDSEGDADEMADGTEKSVRPEKRKLEDDTLEDVLQERHERFKRIRNEQLDLWYSKTRLQSGSKAGSKSFEAFEQPPGSQIEQIMSNRTRLIKRTQMKRSDYIILGKIQPEVEKGKQTTVYDSEIFDDDDFYHQILRELIESKTSSDSTDPTVISRQWIEIQKIRSKMKKKVDTRASKGRKIRDDTVHKLLVNYMAPIKDFEMTDEAKDELFSSLFGNKAE